jgi:hypothetical protein
VIRRLDSSGDPSHTHVGNAAAKLRRAVQPPPDRGFPVLMVMTACEKAGNAGYVLTAPRSRVSRRKVGSEAARGTSTS